MEYKVITRPKLPRNKFGDVENKDAVGGGNSYFSSPNNQGGSSTAAEYSEFVGATNTLDGKKGLVPAPKTNNDEPLITNDKDKFLKGSGAWTDIPISRYTTENANKDGIDLNGNLTVSDTITTQTLNVLGAAHFWELVIDKVKAAGGNLLITPANFQVDFVGSDVEYTIDYSAAEYQSPFKEMFFSQEDETGILGLKELFQNNNLTKLKAKRLYMIDSDNSNRIVSEFEIGDMVRCKTLNLDENSGFTNKDYWTFVLKTGTETHNSKSCLYIDVLYQYVANNTTYGLGTTMEWQDTPIDTHLTLHEDDMEIGVDFMCQPNQLFIATSDKSSGNCEIRLANVNGEEYHGNLTWNGTKWIVDGEDYGYESFDINPNTSFYFAEDTYFKGYLECVYDERWANPVIKVYAIDKNTADEYSASLDSIFYAFGTFYLEDDVDDSGSSTTPLLESFKFGYGTFTPEIGDNIVALGHLWEGDRQSAILISSYDPMDTELKAPALAQYEGINKFTSLSPFRTTSIAANGNNFEGKFLVNYNGNYIDINERLNIFNADLNTGLETVGIHLDGENSTIKLVGSVEIKQNGDNEPDTLTVWDNADKMRVKISPEAIPNLSNIDTQINPTSVKNFRTLSGQNTPTGGSIGAEHSYKYFMWIQWEHQWRYYTQNAYYSYISTVDIGNYVAGQKISVSNLYTDISSKAYFKGIDYVSTRSASGINQSISSVILRLKRWNGSIYATVQAFNISNAVSKSVANETANITYNNSIIDNYTLPTTGSYRLELEIVYNVYASITYGSEQTSPYFMFNYSVRSRVDLTQPSSSMTRIGRNGIVFNTDSVGQYFYAGNDGIEMKWGDSELTLSGADGFKINYRTTTLTDNSTHYIQPRDSYVVCTSISTDTNIYLPNAADYGVGRILTIIGNDYITIKSYTNSDTIYTEKNESTSISTYPSKDGNPFTGIISLPMSSTYTTTTDDGDGGDITTYHRTHNSFVRLMCSGAGWYII